MGDKSSDMGGPAFPVFPETMAAHASAYRGMTLWDYYAASALSCLGDVKFMADRLGKNHASIAAEIADAMLTERRKRMGTTDSSEAAMKTEPEQVVADCTSKRENRLVEEAYPASFAKGTKSVKTEPEQIVADYMARLWTSKKSTDRVIEAMADDLRELAGSNRHVAEFLRRKAVGLQPTLEIAK